MILAAILILQDADALLRRLSSEDAATRDAASAELQTLDPESREIDAKVEAAGRSADPEVAARARKILSYRRLSRQVEDWSRLIDEIASADPFVRRRAVDVFVRLDREAIPYLADLVDDDDPNIVRSVVYRLADIGDPAAAEPLRFVLRSETMTAYYCRAEAMRGLAALKDELARETAFAVLGRLRENPAGFERIAAVMSDVTSDPQLIEPAIAAAAGPFRSEQSLAMFLKIFPASAYAAAILRGVADWEEARVALRPLVLERLREPRPGWLTPAADVVAAMEPRERIDEIRALLNLAEFAAPACLLIGRLKDAESIPPLLRIVKYGAIVVGQPGTSETAAAWALGEIAAEDSVPSLLELWRRKRQAHVAGGVHTALPSILAALGRIGDPRALPALREALSDPEEEIRYAAATALARIGTREEVRALMERIDDVIGFPLYADDPAAARLAPIVRTDATVREAALGALESIVGTAFEGTPAEQAAAWRAWWAGNARDYP